MVLLKSGEAASRLSVCQRTIRNLISAGKLSAVNVSNCRIPRYRIPETAIDEFLARRTTGGREDAAK